MRILLDTHALLWAAQGTLAGDARELVESRAEAVFVSAASVWEIEIKRAVGRLSAPSELLALIEQSGFQQLPISLEHAREAGRLPQLHADPFDRMLIAQARLEALTLVSADAAIGGYDVAVIEIARG